MPVDRYFAMVDCNNFYANCERVFQPTLRGKPVVVLSNNDGCVIARSAEAKVLNVPMGQPLFKLRQHPHFRDVHVFSSNYTLYGDMARRVVEILREHCADIEVYSIDEAFLELRFPTPRTAADIEAWGRAVRRRVAQCTGLPVSVGVARTKTLAKLANHIAKGGTTMGTYYLPTGHAILEKLSISKVWGVGGRYRFRLEKVGVFNVRQLQEVRESWMHKEFGVVGLRLLKELKGQVCLPLEPPVSSRKHTMISRSFPKDVYHLPELERRLSIYVSRLGEKLRRYDQVAGEVGVYLWTNKYKLGAGAHRHCYQHGTRLGLATSNTGTLIQEASRILRKLYRTGIGYKKVGILASDLRPRGLAQGNIFQSIEEEWRTAGLMETVDEINEREGRHTVYYASCGERPVVTTRQAFLSQCYSTRLVWTCD